MVTFRPSTEGIQGAFARTDEEGKYELSSSASGSTGVAPGEYRVTVTKTEVAASNVASEDDPNYDPYATTAPQMKSVLPQKYANAKTSDLSVTVKEGSNEIPLELTD